MGTAAYMAPERIRGQPGDERSDIYALGCVLYAMLTGGPPFLATENVAVLHQQLHSQPLSPRARGARINSSLESLVLTMLAKDPAARPQTAAGVAAQLPDSLLDGTAATAPIRVPAEGRAHRGWLTALAVLAGLVLLVAVVAALGSAGGGPAKASRAASRVSHRATGSYHEAATQATPPSATTPAQTSPAPKKTKHAGPKGPDGGGPPGHDGGGPPGQGPKSADGGD
jgi:serine/threonine-protein kinase